MMYANFVDEEELEGRTVKKVVNTCDYIIILFADGFWTSIHLSRGYYQGEESIVFEQCSEKHFKEAMEGKI